MGNNLNYMRRRMQLGAQPHKAKASGAVATFRTNLAARLDSLFVDVTPVQDLHGQAYPYPPGGGKNLFNKDGTDTTNGYVAGYYLFSTGVLNQGSDWSTSEYIKVDPNTQYTASGISGNSPSICQYDSEKAFVSGTAYGGNTSVTITTGASVAYVRLSYRTDNVGAVQLEKGSTATAYAPYSNVCPITGWAAANVTGTGKNLFDPESTGKEWVDTSNVLGYRNGAKSNRVACSEGMSFTLLQKNASSSRNVMLISFLDKNDKVLSRKVKANGDIVLTDTAPAGAVVCLASFLAWTDTDEQQLEIGSTATAYTPYVGTTAVIQFGSTLYGARIDWNGRKAVADRAMFVPADVSLVTTASTGIKYALCGYTPFETFQESALSLDKNISSEYQFRKTTAPTTSGWFRINGQALYIFDNRFVDKATAQSIIEAEQPQFVYELKTPLEIPLDLVDFVTVPGVNNVFADCGNVDLSYWTNV